MTPAHFPVPTSPELTTGRLRVATIPGGGPYLDAVLPPDVVRVSPSAGPGPWLAATYLAEHACEIDVLHLHTGSGPVTAAAVQCWSEAVRRSRIPLVVTVHRVQDAAPRRHAAEDDHLDAVLGTAEVVLTLTSGAADAIAERFGRTAIVVAHPRIVLPDPDLGAERGLVGLRLGAPPRGLGNQPALVRAALSGAVSGGGRLRVLAETGARVHPSVQQIAERGELELVLHRDEERATQFQQLHVAVLPEPGGAHSRDLEICRDVGTRVVAPSWGWFAGQWGEVVTYGVDDRGDLDPVSLNAAVAAALTRPMLRPADQEWRNEQLRAVRRVHAEVYRQVAGDRAWT